MKWLILILGIVANASASVLIKVAVTPPRKLPSPGNVMEALGNWPLWSGIALYGVAFLLYALALTKLPLNIAHPVLTVGAIAAVAICSSVIFHEPFHWTTIVGLVLVIGGVSLITMQAV